MRTIHWHLAKLYAINVAVLGIVLLSVVVAIDVFMNLKRFTDAAEQLAELQGEPDPNALSALGYTVLVIGDVWAPRLLLLFNAMSGLILVVAMGFTCAQLVRHRELVALVASGVSLRRLAWPFLVVGAVVMGAQALNQELAVPRVARLLVRDINDAVDHGARALDVRLTPDGQGRLFHAERFDPATGDLGGLTVWERAPDRRITGQVAAKAARWSGDRWVLTEGVRIDPTTDPPTATPTAELITPLGPDHIRIGRLEGFGAYLSWSQISHVIDAGRMDDRQREYLERARWGRIAMLASNLLTLAAATPFFLLRLPQPMLGPAVKCLPIAAAGLVASAAASVVELPGIPGPISAFVPTLILAPIAVAMLAGIRT